MIFTAQNSLKDSDTLQEFKKENKIKGWKLQQLQIVQSLYYLGFLD